MTDDLMASLTTAPTGPSEVGGGPDLTAQFEPVVLAFTCNWCSYRAADLAGTARIKYPPNVRLIRLMCSGRLDPTFVMQAFAHGADAVLMTGCWPADCHYRIQNVKALRRFELLRRVLEELGIEPGRFQRFYASAAEGQQLAAAFTRVVEEVRALGPLGWGRVPEVDADVEQPPDPSAAEMGPEASADLDAPVPEEVRP
jgi:F420-non-reducing hydrogenase iron-sulfur subunit